MASEDRDDRDEPSRIMDVLADAFDIAGAKQQMREAECARDGHQWRTPHMPSLPEHEQAWLSANDHIYGRCKKVEYEAPPAWGSEGLRKCPCYAIATECIVPFTITRN